VCDLETSKNEEAKARYRAVKIPPQWVVTPGKQTKQTILQILVELVCFKGLYEFPDDDFLEM
jgi:hypothetical protein